jgi:hypothetical protein
MRTVPFSGHAEGIVRALTLAPVRAVLLAGLAVAAILLRPVAGRGQDAQLTATTSVQYVTIRRLVEDSVPVEETRGDGLLRRALGGQIVRCVTGERVCRFTRSADPVSMAPIIQDVTVSAWGYTPGLRVYAHLRTRTEIGGGSEFWPRADDSFDALAAYAELDRQAFRVRAGRQWKTSGLGFYTFDGVSILVRSAAPLSIEAYGGWSLVRGISEPHTTGALAAIEPLAPDERALLLGAALAYRPTSRSTVSAVYQREIRTDRLGLYSERLSLAGSLTRSRVAVNGSLEADVASRIVNEAHLRTRVAVRPDLAVNVYARRYRPFFELWTIWGAFAPVGFTEFGISGALTPAEKPFAIDVDAARRAYSDTDASTAFGTVRSSGWRIGVSSSVQLDPVWMVSGRYALDIGLGAARSDGGVRVQRQLGENGQFGASALAFQRLSEFRVSEGVVLGLTADGALKVARRTRVGGSLGIYRHEPAGSTPDVNWSQLRGSFRFEWTLGADPDALAQAGGAALPGGKDGSR